MLYRGKRKNRESMEVRLHDSTVLTSIKCTILLREYGFKGTFNMLRGIRVITTMRKVWRFHTVLHME